MAQWRSCAQSIKVNRRELEDNDFQLDRDAFRPKLIWDDLYEQGYWVLKGGVEETYSMQGLTSLEME